VVLLVRLVYDIIKDRQAVGRNKGIL